MSAGERRDEDVRRPSLPPSRLQEGIASEENRDFYCEVIVDETRKIDSLVKELLLISQIEAGYLKIEMNDINVGMMVRRIMDKYYYDFGSYRVSYPEKDILPVNSG